LVNTSSKSFTFSITNFNLLELVELHDGACQMHDVLASFQERIKSNKQCVCSDLPLIFRLSFVVKICIFEFVTNVKGKRKLIVGFFWLFSFDEAKDFFTTDLANALVDDSVANFSDQHNKPGWSVVMLRVSPDKQNSMHDRDEQFSNIIQLFSTISELIEKVTQSLEVLVIFVGFTSGSVNFFL
jgi:hypothetical protein